MHGIGRGGSPREPARTKIASREQQPERQVSGVNEQIVAHGTRNILRRAQGARGVITINAAISPPFGPAPFAARPFHMYRFAWTLARRCANLQGVTVLSLSSY